MIPDPTIDDYASNDWQDIWATPEPTEAPTPDPTQDPADATMNAKLDVPSGPATTPEPLVDNVETLRTGLDLNTAFTALLGIACLGYVIYLGYAMMKK